MPRVPDIPGKPVQRHSEQELWLKSHVARLCGLGLDHDRFPGSQPVSFGMKDLGKLEAQDYWVCEKSDGVRVLFLVQTDLSSNTQTIYLIDRRNIYYELAGFFFPHHADPRGPLKDTLVDGELVIDTDPRTAKTLRFLAFDCLVVDEQNVMSRPLDKRYGRLKDYFYKPYSKMIVDLPHMAARQPFEIKVKEINASYGIEKIFNVDIPALQHGNDGLIYTCVNAPYKAGTDENVLKWKPPSENSIDFKLVLRFPPLSSNPNKPDYRSKPFFGLQIYCGDERGTPKYEPYDELYVEDEEWEKMKLSEEQFDDRIVEVHWNPDISRWRLMRFRDDKQNGNYRTVVENIIQSILDGVEKETLLVRSNSIRSAWKARLAQPQQPTPAAAPPSRGPSAFRSPVTDSAHPRPSHSGPVVHPPPPEVSLRYGPIATSRWSRVAGPSMVAGMYR
ncbi:hypothetical protein SERLADRAFT_475657 [Serpula lacrymans var. lacrymans S7.9]|uniref:mRNA-capping enzyme subunit alpha n=1 Tax=Serpula lacrymans var. lacrymans (strain S7.9) TaxID=578457 RepID=F8P6G2_SERL9|nr:uncharacterized protein SERLADRAFT_475657 [Serpula lacrymans var. lacrymans S7.9]EGO21029.1 hypothetical protein SERLADRAFT_475657 [Serpula lacrymans var. lacrymans S7.9]